MISTRPTIVIEKARLAQALRESVTLTVNRKVPAAVGVPASAALLVKTTPGGRSPDAEKA